MGKNKGGRIVIDYKLVIKNDHKSNSYTVSSLEEFAKMLESEWDKAYSCKDIVY